MGNWDQELKGNIQVYNKATNRLEEHRRAHVYGQQELFVFTILLKPSLLGMVDQKIRMTFQQEDGVVHKIDYPILGLVAASSSVMVDTKDSNLKGLMRSKGDKFIGFLPPDPAIILDVSHELVPQKGGAKIIPQNLALFKNKQLQEILSVRNSFTNSTNGMELYNPNQDFTFTYFSSARISSLNEDQTAQLGQFNFNLRDMTTSHGHKYFFVFSNNTYFPQYIQITDRKLICSIAEDYQPVRYQDCENGVNLDFGRIGLYQPK